MPCIVPAMRLSSISEESISIWAQRLDEFGAETDDPVNLNRRACLEMQIGDILNLGDCDWVVQERQWYFPDSDPQGGHIESTLTIYVRLRP